MAFLEIHPRHHAALAHEGLSAAGDFLRLGGLIHCGHPDRHVARLELGPPGQRLAVFLKREHRVAWRDRWASAWAGCGFVTKSRREYRLLQQLAAAGVGCPEPVAVGEHSGRAFLLLREVPDGVDLRRHLAACRDPARRRALAAALGRALARVHAAGFDHPDLYAKHVLVSVDDDGAPRLHFLDWQRSRRRPTVPWARRCRDLAVLDATLADGLVSPRERLRCLAAYLRASPGLPPLRRAAGHVRRHANRLLTKRRLRELREATPDRQRPGVLWLDGEALCVTPAFAAELAGRVPHWLRLGDAGWGLDGVRTSAVALGHGRLGTLTRRSCRRPLAALGGMLRHSRPTSPELARAALLFRLERHGVAAPRLLAFGQRLLWPWRAQSFLLTETPVGLVSLADWLRAASGPARRMALAQAARLLRRLHDAGCSLAAAEGLAVRAVGGTVSVLLANLDGVRRAREPRSRLAARDLRRLIDQNMLICSSTERLRFLLDYLGVPWKTAEARRLARAMRGTGGDAMSETFWQRLVRGVRRVRARPDWPQFAGADWPERIMQVAVTDRFHAKQGRSTGRWVLHADGRRLGVYLKRHYRLGWWQGLLATLWPDAAWSPALQEWRHLEWARSQGLAVPRAVAVGQYVGPWGRLQSVLAVEELTDMLPLHEAIPLAARSLDAAAFARWKRTLIAELARLTRELHGRRRFHKDLYLCHFYIPRADALAGGADWHGRVHLIDLHRLSRHLWTWPLWQVKDLAQLLYSSEVEGLDARDRLRFWRHYLGAGRRTVAGRWLRWCVRVKWGRYRRHNRKRARA